MLPHTPPEKPADEVVYIRTELGQEKLSKGIESGLTADQQRALLLINGFTPVCALFGPQTLSSPVEGVLAFLSSEGLIAPIDTPRVRRKWFGPAIVALGASLNRRK